MRKTRCCRKVVPHGCIKLKWHINLSVYFSPVENLFYEYLWNLFIPKNVMPLFYDYFIIYLFLVHTNKKLRINNKKYKVFIKSVSFSYIIKLWLKIKKFILYSLIKTWKTNTKDWRTGVRSRFIRMSENDLFSGRTHVWFLSCIKFHWVSDNQVLRARLIYDPVGWETSVVFNLRKENMKNWYNHLRWADEKYKMKSGKTKRNKWK